MNSRNRGLPASASDRRLATWRHPLLGLLATLLLLSWILLRERGVDPDLFTRVAVGRLVQIQGEVPARDPFAYTLTKPVWIDHEWLSGVIFHALARFGGDPALVLFELLISASSIVLLARARLRWSAERRLAIPALLALAVSVAHVWTLTIRPQVFSYLFIPLFLHALARHARDGSVRTLIPLPLVMAFWVQVHGGFVVGLGFLAIYAVCRSFRRARPVWPVWASLLACAGAIWMNPYTDTSFWRFMLETVILDRPGMIGWQPLSLLSPAALVLHLFVLLIGIGLFRAARSGAGLAGVEPFAWALLLSALFFGERHQRLAPIPMMVAYVFFSDLMARALTVGKGGWIGVLRRAARKGRTPALWASIALLAGACALRLYSSGLALDYRPYPVSALEWLANHRPGGKLLVGSDAGGFALWRLYPRFNVSLDGRHEEVYPQATVRAVEEALDPGRPHHAESLESVLPDFILVRGRYDQADPARGFGSRWQPVYQDEQYAILETAGGPSPAVAGPGTGTVDVWMPRF